MDKTFARLMSRLNGLLFAATLLEREPNESFDDEYIELLGMYEKICDARKANMIGECQKDALIAMYHEVAEVYHRAMD